LGYRIMAVEPSEEMRRQAVHNKNITWVPGFTESIPLADNLVDGVIVILALHPFKDAQKAILELKPICPTGPVVVSSSIPVLAPNNGFITVEAFVGTYKNLAVFRNRIQHN
jgi:ubiquinone/menaquinone biosynthesis C-methylase UbiE